MLSLNLLKKLEIYKKKQKIFFFKKKWTNDNYKSNNNKEQFYQKLKESQLTLQDFIENPNITKENIEEKKSKDLFNKKPNWLKINIPR